MRTDEGLKVPKEGLYFGEAGRHGRSHLHFVEGFVIRVGGVVHADN